MPSAARLALATLLGVLAVSLVTGTSAAVDAAGGGSEGWALATSMLEGALALLALSAGLLSTRPLCERLGLRRSHLDGPALALAAVGALALSHGLDGLLSWSGLWEHSALADFGAQLEGARGRLALWFVLAFAVAPAVAEELLCRGLIQQGLVTRLGPAGAVAASSLAFGALHLEPIHGAFAGLLGIYLGTVAHWAGSIRPAILCHLANNLLAVLLAIHAGDALRGAPGGVLPALALCGACLWGVRRRVQRGREHAVTTPAEAFHGIGSAEAAAVENRDSTEPTLQPSAQPDDR